MRLEKRLLSHNDLSHEDEVSTEVDGTKDYDVVIVGNGPSAIILSFLLSGHWPYYNGKPVDDPVLAERLKYMSQSKSLVLQDLDWLSEGLYDSRTLNPVSILFDHLFHPNADMLTNDESLIEWKYSPENEVRHLVLGLGQPGGSWHHMTNTQLTVSLVKWLELPGYTFREWYKENELKVVNLPKVNHVSGVHPGRTNALYVGLYYADYVKQMGLSSNFINNVRVTNVYQCGGNSSQWIVEGIQYGEELSAETFSIKSDNVALACGAFNIPRKLSIPGEDYSFVHHKLPDPESFRHHKCPVLVVGCGLVALDTVLSLMAEKIQVIHVFRRSAKDPELIINQLSSAYADYLKLKPLIQNKSPANEYYIPFPQHVLAEILPNKNVVIEHVNRKVRFKMHVSKAIINIGLLPDLSFLKDSTELREDPLDQFHIKNNPLDIDLYTHECRTRPGLYALGPLVGDNFIRFISGGALAVTHGLFRNEYEVPSD